jgi:dTDP-4-dehydrorhamnose reductase
VDITDKESLSVIRDYHDANFVLHFAAKTDVDDCERDREFREDGDAWKINVNGAKNVAEVCRDLGKKIIYVSTDFVFDGDKQKGEFYTENDIPNPINWYAETKYQGEKVVGGSGASFIILRFAYPYRAKFDPKKDFVRGIIDSLDNGNEVKAITDHVFCPTLIDDIAYALDVLMKNDATGIFHAVGNDPITPYEGAMRIAQIFDLDSSLIKPTTREEFFKDRAPRPFNLNLRNDKINRLGVKMKGFDEGLGIIKSQI